MKDRYNRTYFSMANKYMEGNYMSIKMIANGKARDMVDKRAPFRGSNVWGAFQWDAKQEVTRYVVYSYRYTWPLYVYDSVADTWFENDSQYSQTTSRHRNQCRPTGVETVKLKVEDMLIVADKGVVGLIEKGVM